MCNLKQDGEDDISDLSFGFEIKKLHKVLLLDLGRQSADY